MKFILNFDEWEIKEIEQEKLLKIYNENYDEESNFCFGVTIYPQHKIWINKNMCEEQKIKTLKHELTHAYIWEHGLYNVPSFTEEMVCDLVAACSDIVMEISSNYELYKKGINVYELFGASIPENKTKRKFKEMFK
jgi:hypothetical protein